MYTHTLVWLIPLVISLLFSVRGCFDNVVSTLDDAITLLDDTRVSIVAESTNWRGELPKLVAALEGVEKNAAADVKGVVADTKNQLQDLSEQTIRMTAAEVDAAIRDAGTEFRCNADFVKEGALAELQYLIDDLKFWKANGRHSDQRPTHVVCAIEPSALGLYPTEGTWRIETSNMREANIVDVYGYNFRPDQMPGLELQDASGRALRQLDLNPAYVTRYKISLNFAGEDFHGVTANGRIVFLWPDKSEANTISFTVVEPAKLEITQFSIEPASPIMQTDPVTLRVTIKNTGGSRSGSFTVLWQQDTSDLKELSIPRTPLNAGESIDLSLPGGLYQHAGAVTTLVHLDTGDASATREVTVRPNVQESVSVCTIQEPVVTRRWAQYPGSQYPDCALRPGDQLEIVQAGGCVQTGGHGDTTKRYVDPKNGDCNNDGMYFGMIAVPGTIDESENRAIRDFWHAQAQQPTTISSLVSEPVLELGYADDDYGDNGYWGMGDTGNCDQCRNERNAFIVLRITHHTTVPHQASSPESFGMEFDTDRAGGDYQQFELTGADPALCQSSCYRDAQCRAWTYVKPGIQSQSAVCWLKQSVPDARPDACCISGVNTMEYDTDRRGGDYQVFNVPDADPTLCQASCYSDAQCRAWTFVKPGIQDATAVCWLKQSVPEAGPDACCISGVVR